ncbi:hypothetical protein PR048_033662 [Dryococelus australis]|uniref:Ig-like domain-containing protein n=1 Tax=Dryococelus australis TaxID=614101 RepID=A0ABQ9G0X8_9NEOP|nr:hypothetical protein PR048_033662 [Dryococelus australis]
MYVCGPCYTGMAVLGSSFDSQVRGPSFLLEPPARLEFSNSSGCWLDCSASGSPPPAIDWLGVDGSPVGDVHSVRRVLRNGTLMLLPFSPAAYRQDIHSTVYRCAAANVVGRIVSRDVQVRAGMYHSSRPLSITLFVSSAGTYRSMQVCVLPHVLSPLHCLYRQQGCTGPCRFVSFLTSSLHYTVCIVSKDVQVHAGLCPS